MLRQVREIAPWFALWGLALYMTLLGWVWNAQGKPVLAFLAAVAALGAITSMVAKALQPE